MIQKTILREQATDLEWLRVRAAQSRLDDSIAEMPGLKRQISNCQASIDALEAVESKRGERELRAPKFYARVRALADKRDAATASLENIELNLTDFRLAINLGWNSIAERLVAEEFKSRQVIRGDPPGTTVSYSVGDEA